MSVAVDRSPARRRLRLGLLAALLGATALELLDAALLGASLLISADALARVVVAPAELPVGIVTTLLGAPLFLGLLLQDLRGRA